MAEKKPKPIAKVTHYFSNIKVAVVKLLAPLSVGDKVRITGGEDTDFKQTVKSIESEHKKVKKSKKGAEVGIKVDKKVREGYRVFKI